MSGKQPTWQEAALEWSTSFKQALPSFAANRDPVTFKYAFPTTTSASARSDRALLLGLKDQPYGVPTYDYHRNRDYSLMLFSHTHDFDFDTHRVPDDPAGFTDELLKTAFRNVLAHNALPILPPGYYWDLELYGPKESLRHGHIFGRIHIRVENPGRKSVFSRAKKDNTISWTTVSRSIAERFVFLEEALMYDAVYCYEHSETKWGRRTDAELFRVGTSEGKKRVNEAIIAAGGEPFKN